MVLKLYYILGKLVFKNSKFFDLINFINLIDYLVVTYYIYVCLRTIFNTSEKNH